VSYLQDITKNRLIPPLLVVLTGPSGVGKDAAITGLKKLDRLWQFVVTATTRRRRPGEKDGIDYIFMNADIFRKMKDQNEFLEYAQVYGHWYGVPRNQVRHGLAAGKDVILKVDVQGAATVRTVSTEAVSIFMEPGSFKELRDRLAGRLTESSPEMERRLSVAQEEMNRIHQFDYRVVNHDNGIDATITQIDAIITAEKCRVTPRKAELR
jgi:guanylate kinase